MSDYGLIDGDSGFGANNNGRVMNIGAGTGPPSAFQLFSDDAGRTGTFGSDTLQHIWKAGDPDSASTNLFMSKKNLDALQDAIRYRVWVETGGRQVIGRQSDAELTVVMRSIALQHARNDGRSDPVEQVRDLNSRVLNWTVPRIVGELSQYLQYRQDASTLPMPMAHGGLATSKGTKNLEFKRFF
jgi:hypothetical protein